VDPDPGPGSNQAGSIVSSWGAGSAAVSLYARDIGARAKLEQHFLMVYWEQRGTGKSFSRDIPPASMTIKQLIADTHQLTILLQDRFQAPKIFLVGRSFGSLIGILAVKRRPELYYAYISICQLSSETIIHAGIYFDRYYKNGA
jgi:pimeloyl-ACP methyl ester carboxylesterase